MNIGANYLGEEKCEFRLWAPLVQNISVKIYPDERIIPMDKERFGYWSVTAGKVPPGTLYKYLVNGVDEYPDPASHSQPQGVFGPSEVIEHTAFVRTDAGFTPVTLKEMVIYELHVGTFTDEGTFEAIIPRLDELRSLGITALEIMPVAQFPGERNWGYDGVYPFAPQNSYGGPEGLKRLVNAAHRSGLTVILDVVYNHFGPEGNFISKFGPYFTSKYKTPWGDSINYDDAYSDEVRNYFFENAKYWLEKYNIDALRLDAIHSIYDLGAKHFLQEIKENIEELSNRLERRFTLIAESDLNDIRIVTPIEHGGYGMDAQWSDDFHHSLHTLLTGEKEGYYADFGKTDHLIKALKNSYVYTGEYSRVRKRRHGNSPSMRPAWQFVVSTQNHDQIGNRAFGERLSRLINFEATKLAAGVLCLSPYVPLIFMGEEYREDAPFMYFVSHTDAKLVEAVQNGRRSEFGAFQWQDEIPDPQSIETFTMSKLQWENRYTGKNALLLDLYKTLLELRREIPALKNYDRNSVEVHGADEDKVIIMKRRDGESRLLMAMNFNSSDTTVFANFEDGRWKKIVDSSDVNWGGPGSQCPDVVDNRYEGDLTLKELSFVVYEASADDIPGKEDSQE